MTVVSCLLVVLHCKDVYRCLFLLVCSICIGVRIVSNVCSGFCCNSLVVHIFAQPVVPLVAKDSTERFQR